jgi:hypothetical protein
MMGKHMVRIRLLPVITAVALVTGISAGGAQAVSYQGSSRAVASSIAARPAQAAGAASPLAPCTTPLFGSYHECESTSPLVNRWVQFKGSGDRSCTFTLFVDWGDGSSSSRTFVGPIPAVYLIASHTYSAKAQTTTYTETVTSSVDSGTCNSIPTTVFKFTHLKSAVAPSLDRQSLGGLGISKDCQASILKDLGVHAVEFGILIGAFARTGNPRLIELLAAIGGAYLVIEFVRTCVTQPTHLLALPRAFAYGAAHPGKLFKPSGRVPPRPQITGIYGYQKGSLVYFSLHYANPDHDAKGFGFVGIKGAGWAEENHPFSHPSYGIVGNNSIDYPFNLACGTAHEYKSYVEAWIYDSHGQRSNPVEVDLSCAT